MASSSSISLAAVLRCICRLLIDIALGINFLGTVDYFLGELLVLNCKIDLFV